MMGLQEIIAFGEKNCSYVALANYMAGKRLYVLAHYSICVYE